MAIAVATFTSPRKYSRLLTASLLISDVLFLALSSVIADRAHNIPLVAIEAMAVASLAVLAISGTYRPSLGASARDEWYAVGAALTLTCGPLILLSFAFPPLRNAQLEIAEFAAMAFIGIAGTRTVAHRKRLPRRLAIIGVPERIDVALVHLRPRRDDALLRLPISNIEATLEDAHAVPPWLQGAMAWGATRVIVTEALPPEQFLRLMRVTARQGISIAIAPTRLRPQAYQMHVEREGGLTLLCPRPLPICTPAAQIFKRTLDLALTLPALIALIPVLILCAIAIKLDSPGPVIYRQTRVGKNGKPFEMLKFRSMPVNVELATGPVWADPSVPRATRTGRFLRRASLDEIPQLINVLRGEMSLIGPRPERPYFVDRFRRVLPRYDERLLVSPGITGWSQISMSRILATDEVTIKLEGDLLYLEEWTPLLDIQIIVKTAFEFLFQRVA